MHLVTLLAACTLGIGVHGASCLPTHTSQAGDLLAIRVGDLGDTASSPGDINDPLGCWHPFITEASRRFGIPESWIRAVIAAESGGRQTLGGHPITSPAGAMGLMQVMPETYAEMRLRHGLGADPYDPRDNILAGTAYLRALYDRYGSPGVFAAYNAGPARFDDYLLRGVPLPEETQQYLLSISPELHEAIDAERRQRVAHLRGNNSRTVAPPSGNALFFPLGMVAATSARTSVTATGGQISVSDSTESRPASGRLFVPLTSPRKAVEQARPHP